MHPSDPNVHTMAEGKIGAPQRGRERRRGRDTVVISRKEQDIYLRRCGPGESPETHECRGDLDPELEQMLLAL